MEPAIFRVNVNDTEVKTITGFNHLGIQIDITLHMNMFFDKCCRKASSRRSLLAKLLGEMFLKLVKAIYESAILPTFTDFGILLLCNTRTHSNDLESFQNRAEAIVNRIFEIIYDRCEQEARLHPCQCVTTM